MPKKILKNQTGSAYQVLNIDLINTGTYDVQPLYWLDLSAKDDILSLVTAGAIVVNNGVIDFPADIGRAHIENPAGVTLEHSDITLHPGFGGSAPAGVAVSTAVMGHEFLILDEVFGQTRIDNPAGGSLALHFHACINNTVADRWIQFEVRYVTSNGNGDKVMSATPTTVTVGPVLVPTVANQIFQIDVTIPLVITEPYLYMGFRRVTATGKTAPTNNPVMLRYCKQYYKKLD